MDSLTTLENFSRKKTNTISFLDYYLTLISDEEDKETSRIILAFNFILNAPSKLLLKGNDYFIFSN